MLKRKAGYSVALLVALFVVDGIAVSQTLAPSDAVQVVLSSYRVDPPAWILTFKNVSERKIAAFGAELSPVGANGQSVSAMARGTGVDFVEEDAKEELRKVVTGVKVETFRAGETCTITLWSPSPPPISVKVVVTSVVFDDNTAYGDPARIDRVFRERALRAEKNAMVLREIKAVISGERPARSFEPAMKGLEPRSLEYAEFTNLERLVRASGPAGLTAMLPFYEATQKSLQEHLKRSN
jgi:hypothetical protein